MQPTATTELDRHIKELQTHKEVWARLAVGAKAALLDEVRRLAARHASDWVEVAAGIKGLPLDSPYLGEEWASGPWALLHNINWQLETLQALAAGDPPPLPRNAVRTRGNGRVAVKVFPHDVYDRLLLGGIGAEVWMEPEVTPGSLLGTMARFYADPAPTGTVSLVLGAGNILSIAPLDLIYKMFGEGQVCLLKLHPVTDSLGPVLEQIFEPLITSGFVAVCHGGADVGEYLCRHDGIDAIHVTGSEATHDAIVFGRGPAGKERKARNEPLLAKPITSELGNVTPSIVVPGPWSDRDVAYQAEHLASQKLHNSGFNCLASQVLILPESWDRSEGLVDALRSTMRSVAGRPAYYPGASDRHGEFMAAYPRAELLGGELSRALVTGLDPDGDEYCYRNEVFGPMYGQVSLPGDSAAAFLDGAVEFCNDRLRGTLAADMIVHPRTIKELGPRLGEALSKLRYGTVGVNVWNGFGYLMGTPWGGYAASEEKEVRSGRGVVHNTRLFSRSEKTVGSGPFRPFPRSLASGSFHLMTKPQWFVTNRRAHDLGRRITAFVADPGPRHLPGLFAAALRG